MIFIIGFAKLCNKGAMAVCWSARLPIEGTGILSLMRTSNKDIRRENMYTYYLTAKKRTSKDGKKLGNTTLRNRNKIWAREKTKVTVHSTSEKTK